MNFSNLLMVKVRVSPVAGAFLCEDHGHDFAKAVATRFLYDLQNNSFDFLAQASSDLNLSADGSIIKFLS